MSDKKNKRKQFIHKPYYEGGPRALRQFVQEQLTYPTAARAAGQGGSVRVYFSITNRGRVVDAHIKKSLGHGLDEEAIRVVSLLRFTVPKTHKLKVKYHRHLDITFHPTGSGPARPAVSRRKATAPQLAYTLVKQQPPAPADRPAPKSSGYTYTIAW